MELGGVAFLRASVHQAQAATAQWEGAMGGRNGRAQWEGGSLRGPSIQACATMAKVDQQSALAVVVAAAGGAEYALCGAVDGSNGAEGE
jgi:hypothetical protein